MFGLLLLVAYGVRRMMGISLSAVESPMRDAA
jgi:hypothetical protein